MQPAAIPQKTPLYGVIFGLWYLMLAVVGGVIVAGAAGALSAIVLLIANPLQTSAQLTADVINTSIISGVVFFLLSIPLIVRAYRNQDFRLENTGIIIEYGFFKKSSVTIPYSDIHYTSVSENPIQRILALSTIHLYLTRLKTPNSFTVFGYERDSAIFIQESILAALSRKTTHIEQPWKQGSGLSNAITSADYPRPNRWYWYTALTSLITSFTLTNFIFFLNLNGRRSGRGYESIASNIDNLGTLALAMSITTLLFTIIAIFHQIIWKRQRAFVCTDDAIWIKQGRIFKHFICVPISTIVHIDVRENTLEALFTLGTVFIRTTQQGDLSKKMYYAIANPFYLSCLSPAHAHRLAKAINEKYKKETQSPATGGWMRT